MDLILSIYPKNLGDIFARIFFEEALMQTRIKGIVYGRRGLEDIDIFGYSSRGVPGLEITGLGKTGNSIKEKFIYLSKSKGLKLPLRRYVLCATGSFDLKELGVKDLSWLEMPFLILFWTLAEVIPMGCLEGCVASGKVEVSGELSHGKIPVRELIDLNKKLGDQWKYIYTKNLWQDYKIKTFLTDELFSMVPNLKINSQVMRK